MFSKVAAWLANRVSKSCRKKAVSRPRLRQLPVDKDVSLEKADHQVPNNVTEPRQHATIDEVLRAAMDEAETLFDLQTRLTAPVAAQKAAVQEVAVQTRRGWMARVRSLPVLAKFRRGGRWVSRKDKLMLRKQTGINFSVHHDHETSGSPLGFE